MVVAVYAANGRSNRCHHGTDMVLTDFSGEVSAIEITAATSGDSDLESEGDLENDTTVDGETNVTVNESTNATAGITAAN